MFGFFKKKEETPHYDPTNLKPTDLRKGYLLDYELKTWQAVEEYEYDWGNEVFSYEYKLVSSDDTIYLYVEDDEVLSVSRKIKFAMLPDEVERELLASGKPPKKIVYNGRTYFRGKESMGFFKEVDDPGESVEFIVWPYEDETEKYILTIEQWGDEDFEASIGHYIKPSEITNILPVKNE